MASFIITSSPTTINTTPITLTVSPSIMQPPRVRRMGWGDGDPEYEEAYGRALNRRIREVADWVRCRHEETSTDWIDTAFNEREWVAAQHAAKHQAMRDALDWSSGNGWTSYVYPKIATTAGTCTTASITWSTANTNFQMPPEYLYNQLRTAQTVHVGMVNWRKSGLSENRVNHHGNPLRSLESGKLFDNASPAEIKALHLLRKMIPNEGFRRYLRHGFITIRGGATGLMYQIDRHKRIAVWDLGKKIAELCIHLNYDSKTPPTDHVVGKMLMAECDETALWKKSNISWAVSHDDENKYRIILGLEPKKPQEERNIRVEGNLYTTADNGAGLLLRDRNGDVVTAMQAMVNYIRQAG